MSSSNKGEILRLVARSTSVKAKPAPSGEKSRPTSDGKNNEQNREKGSGRDLREQVLRVGPTAEEAPADDLDEGVKGGRAVEDGQPQPAWQPETPVRES